MKPNTIPWLAASICAVILGALVFFARILGWVEVNLFVLICAGAVPLVTIYGMVKNFCQGAYEKTFRCQDWIVEDAEVREKVFIEITAKQHKQGRRPSISFEPSGTPYSSTNLEKRVDEKGNIKIIHPQNSFMPPSLKEFRVRIVSG